MSKKKSIIIISVLGLIILVVGIILLNKNNIIKNKSKLQIIDASYSCIDMIERIYEDDNYVYYFSCVKSDSVFVKFENGNKMLVVNALADKKVTMDELIDAGLKVYKEEK